ncbi:RICIN domain-containing protein [Streptomyces sp. NPDC029006]|uniref:RICIN domain-containing protein n=1 Tax=Streptomyces sp. NPDC029006 TaxID=3155467 RepID=UPI0034102C4F
MERVSNVHAGLCLDTDGAGTADDIPLVLWTCNGQADQSWRINAPFSAEMPGTGHLGAAAGGR